jgi:ribosomal protein S12 methylthiotransferase accessory factor
MRNGSRLSPVDERTGLIRFVYDLPVDPGEPRIFNTSVKMADTGRYMPAACFDNNGGSGLTRQAARAAAIGEGIERYCATFYEPEELIFGPAQDLQDRYRLSPPEDYALFHPSQKVEVPPFTADVPIAWTQGYSLVHRTPALVPASQVFMPYQPAFLEQGEKLVGPVISTGLACARSYEEALVKGICEVIERDAFMITWMNCLPRDRVDFCAHPALDRLYRQHLQRGGLRYVLLDMTSDLPVPAYLCLLIDEQRSPVMVCAGGAAALDPLAAASKALLEAVQTREWAKFMLRGGKSFHFEPDFSDIEEFEDHVALYAHGDMLEAVRFLVDSPGQVALDGAAEAKSPDWAADLTRLVSLLAGRGYDVLAVDLTTPDAAQCGYFVTKALIPGFQPLDASYRRRFLGGRRLYQVPVRLGYTQTETTIEQLNPNPHPYP